jgi:hypothetical protein
MNIYIELTKIFNTGKLRAIISSGQAVVLHHIAIMSKDGDWIIKEDEETLEYILSVLSGYGAQYRYGAPLDTRWLSGGWSSHFEFFYNKMRIRTDFVTCPPRISEDSLQKLWQEQQRSDLPFVDIKTLAEIKKTNREKDYVVIGELARLFSDPKEQLLYSRSANDIISLSNQYPNIVVELITERPLLAKVNEGIEHLEEALDSERRKLIHLNEARLRKYLDAADKWQNVWPKIKEEISELNLIDAHHIIKDRANGILPFFV